MMGDAVYASRFVNKYNLFISNGYIPGVNLILTFESEENPLNISNVYKIVSGFAETDWFGNKNDAYLIYWDTLVLYMIKLYYNIVVK